MTRLVFIIGIGGFFGTISRYLSLQLVYKYYPLTFPIGTLLVNLTGCFLIGVFYALAEKNTSVSPELKMFLATGFCGGFTTFSAFSIESVQLINRGEWSYVVLYGVASIFIGILATFFGIWVMKTVL